MPVNNSGTGSINWIIMIIYLKVNYYTCIGVIGICFAEFVFSFVGFFPCTDFCFAGYMFCWYGFFVLLL